MIEKLKDDFQAGNWLWLGVVCFGCIALHSAWHHDSSNAIFFGITAGLCALPFLRR